MKEERSAIVIGGGIGGLATAALLAHRGWRVSLLEKNQELGGLCGRFSEAGFTFDTGPSWYLMPDVFERFFRLLGEDIHAHLELVRPAPSCRIFFEGRPESVDFVSDFEKDKGALISLDPGALPRLERYFARAEEHYRFADAHVLHESRDTLRSHAPLLFKKGFPYRGIFSSLGREVLRVAKTPELRAVLSYPALFLGTEPRRTPALFSMLTYADFGMGVWYPMGGMYEIVRALVRIGEVRGASYYSSAEVQAVLVEEGRAVGIELVSGKKYAADIIISNTDRSFFDRHFIPSEYSEHSDAFWRRKTPGFSAAALFLGTRRKIPELAHHNFFFTRGWEKQFKVFRQGLVPDDLAFYLTMRSATDDSAAPKGMENLFALVPLPSAPAPPREAVDVALERVFQKITARAPSLRDAVMFQKTWYPDDYAKKHGTFGGSLLGLAHTFFQTGPFRPSHRSSRLRNLYFVGSSTNPGIGVPACLLSAEQVIQDIRMT